MNLTIAGINFDQHEYDERGDVLYLSVGAPRAAFRTIGTPEGHAVDYDESGTVIGMVLVNVRFFLKRDGAVTVTIPPDRVAAVQIEPALLICRAVCQVGRVGRVRWAGGLGWSGGRGAGLGVGVASLMMRGLGTPGPGFVLPACAV